jgi:serine/threonine-protein kinase HipA
LYRSTRRRDVPAAFECDAQWLGRDAFLLDPRLGLWGGEQHPPAGATAFGIFMDRARDRWGRVLLERRETLASQREDRPQLPLFEMDFLLGVNDFTRVGGLRFRQGPGAPLLDDGLLAAPPVTSLRALAAVSRRLEDPDAEELPEYEAWLAMLVAPGTALGGARPKANFTENDGSPWIAKFPAREDRYDVGSWEYLLHRLANKARIDVPKARLEQLTERHSTFLVQRFDRTAVDRRMYSSAMALLEHRDGDNASYLELAEFIENNGAQGRVKADLAQLFRRVVFNVMSGNRDDRAFSRSGAWDRGPLPIDPSRGKRDCRRGARRLVRLASTCGRRWPVSQRGATDGDGPAVTTALKPRRSRFRLTPIPYPLTPSSC